MELNEYVCGPQGAAVRLPREQKLETAIFLIKEARVDYDAALHRREHGGVAADRFIRAVTQALDDLN